MATIDQLAKAHRLHDQGKSFCQIAKECGTKYETVRRWLDSDYRERQQEKDRLRKAAYGRPCGVCGTRTDGSNGRANAPKHCRSCAPAAHAKWTRETVIAAIRRFNMRYGRPPTAPDFNPGMARGLGHGARAERFYSDGDYPHSNTVQYVFGTWSDGLRAAGFRPYAQGCYPRTDAPPGSGMPRGAHLNEQHWTVEDAA
jgi:hypothetical protein